MPAVVGCPSARPADASLVAAGLSRTSVPGPGMQARKTLRAGNHRITAANRTNDNARQVPLPGVAHHPMPLSVIEARLDADAHSHSIVAGGLPEMSYTTRLIPRTSLMIRFDARPSSAYGRCAQCAVMKSVVCTARSDVT